jgi:hypothetical protein
MLRPRACLIATILFLTGASYVGAAAAQAPSPARTMGVPTKKIEIYNNTAYPIYPVLTGYIGQYDLWLQAQFKNQVKDPTKQAFCNNDLGVTSCGVQSGIPRNYRAWINPNNGIQPNEFVSITVPFYTQSLDTTSANIGTESGQYIDWWNAQRVYFYVGKTAKTGAFNYNGVDNSDPPNPVPPTPVTPLSGAPIPSCASDNTFNCEQARVVYYKNLFPTGSIPFDYGEYTLAAAEGPPPGGLKKPGSPFTIDLNVVGFDVSAVDGIYLPIAIQALGNSTPVEREYLGTTETFATFAAILGTFSGGSSECSTGGTSWPIYCGSYYSVEKPTSAQPTPQDGDAPYPPFPKVASENVVFAESYKDPAPAPPVLSSDTNGTPMIGTTTQEFVDLWCWATSSDTSTCNQPPRCTTSSGAITCKHIKTVYDFFVTDYQQTCGLSGLPDMPTMLRDVTGWAQFPNCPAGSDGKVPPLVKTPGYDDAISVFCELEYNFLDTKISPEDYFNPYASLVHGTIHSNAYAFSIDDKAAFKSVPVDPKTGGGLIITIGGPKGLAYNEHAPLPNKNTIHQNCH